MPLADYETVMKQAKELDVLQVALGGGNPNQHPDFIKHYKNTVDYIKKNKIEISVRPSRIHQPFAIKKTEKNKMFWRLSRQRKAPNFAMFSVEKKENFSSDYAVCKSSLNAQLSKIVQYVIIFVQKVSALILFHFVFLFSFFALFVWALKFTA